jgi:hypothetical protein
MDTNLCQYVLEPHIRVEAGLITVLIHHKLSDTYEESVLTDISEETKALIRNGQAEVVANKDLYDCYNEYTANADAYFTSSDEACNDVFLIPDSYANKYFDPDFTYAVLEYNIDDDPLGAPLSDFAPREIEAVRCGKAKVVGNKDLFDSYLRQLSPMDITHLESADIPINPFVDTTAIEIEKPVAPIFGDNTDDDAMKTDEFVDASNGTRIAKYMQDNDLSNIYCLVLALISVYVANGYITDLDYVKKIALHALRKIHGFSKDDYDINKMYKEKVNQAVEDMDHLICSLRYKIIPGDKTFTFNGKMHLHPAYTIFANIFANSYFNPYLTEEEDIGRSVDLFDVY